MRWPRYTDVGCIAVIPLSYCLHPSRPPADMIGYQSGDGTVIRVSQHLCCSRFREYLTAVSSIKSHILD